MLRSGVVRRVAELNQEPPRRASSNVATIIDLLAKRGWVDLTLEVAR
jgi:hypothetical protein